MQIKIIMTILAFWFISLILNLFSFIDSIIFIPSKEYRYFSYIYSVLAIGFLIYKIYSKNLLIIVVTFIVIFHLSLLGLFQGFPYVLQYFPSDVVNAEERVVNKHYRQGRRGNHCYYQIELADSFYYGRICTTKEILDSIKIEHTIKLKGKKNIFGFFSKTSSLEEDLRFHDTMGD